MEIPSKVPNVVSVVRKFEPYQFQQKLLERHAKPTRLLPSQLRDLAMIAYFSPSLPRPILSSVCDAQPYRVQFNKCWLSVGVWLFSCLSCKQIVNLLDSLIPAIYIKCHEGVFEPVYRDGVCKGLVTVCSTKLTCEAVDLINRTRHDSLANVAAVAGSQHTHGPLRLGGP
ncbi:hypothetical protein Y032_0390g547 [Ancylostoma ceylanicum]|uniref:Uncharacterized protein n=1 Tax=Ancylostoma ceylanicum TaxID=53326 RepID=A0A016RSU0_9BILA|nr:hypothetical protein Y032_0390g547 [Ancylostoma ceylanicum]